MRSVAITGVSGGIGSALAQAFADDGARVIGIDTTPPSHDACTAFIESDLASAGRDEAAALSLGQRILAQCTNAPLASLINNAAVQHLGPATHINWQNWRETLDVNLGAPFALARCLYTDLAANKGTILNVGSVHATATKPGFAAYATSKAALHGLTQSLALDFAPDVRVVGLAPAAIDTPMLRAGFDGQPEAFADLEATHPMARIGTPQEVADAALFLCSPKAGFMTGTTVYLDGGILSRLHDPA